MNDSDSRHSEDTQGYLCTEPNKNLIPSLSLLTADTPSHALPLTVTMELTTELILLFHQEKKSESFSPHG